MPGQFVLFSKKRLGLRSKEIVRYDKKMDDARRSALRAGACFAQDRQDPARRRSNRRMVFSQSVAPPEWPGVGIAGGPEMMSLSAVGPDAGNFVFMSPR